MKVYIVQYSNGDEIELIAIYSNKSGAELHRELLKREFTNWKKRLRKKYKSRPPSMDVTIFGKDVEFTSQWHPNKVIKWYHYESCHEYYITEADLYQHPDQFLGHYGDS